jgi:hypothetical protein
MGKEVKVILLHHSTGKGVWRGHTSKYFLKLGFKGDVEKWFLKYNQTCDIKIRVEERYFPKSSPYGWKNNPYDYYNIWVRNAGNQEYMEEPTLEILTKQYDVIIWKHCFPVGKILDGSVADVNSDVKTLANYKLQYHALKQKMHEFPDNKFMVWTGASLVESATTPEQSKRAREFFTWVIQEWDEPGDNIFIWDFNELETGGDLYLKPEYTKDPANSHPNIEFYSMASVYFCNRLVSVVEGRGDTSSLTGK